MSLILTTACASGQEALLAKPLWKELTWADKEKQIVSITIWYQSPEKTFARPKIYILDEEDEQLFGADMIETESMMNNIYTIKFGLKMKYLDKTHFMMESNSKELFIDVGVRTILNKPPEK